MLTWRLLAWLLFPAMLLRLLHKSKADPRYRQHLNERLSCAPLGQHRYWLHAVSVGEAGIAGQLLQCWHAQSPLPTILLTCTTPTGRAVLTTWQTAHPAIAVTIRYIPFDIGWLMARTFKRVQPALFIAIETEIWPNLLAQARVHNCRTALINGRLSPRSMRGYLRMRCLQLPLPELIAAQTRQAGKRFSIVAQRFGQQVAVSVTGSIKFDAPLPQTPPQTPPQIPQTPKKFTNFIQYCSNKRVWLVASSRAGEEGYIVEAWRALHTDNTLLIWAPRHPNDFIKHVSQATLPHRLFSTLSTQATQATQAGTPSLGNCIIVDTIGDLGWLYQCADVVFVGGTLVDTGSQNVIEPAHAGKPIVCGPSQYNFQFAHALLRKCGAITPVTNARQLAATVQTLLENPKQAWQQGNAGKQAIAVHVGATRTTIKRLQQLIAVD